MQKSGLSYNSNSYRFHSIMPGLSFNPNEYRFGGAGGQEADDEITGSRSHYTAEYWEYDSRIGRRWNIDPVDKPWMSSYHAYSNSPIWKIDPNGAEDDWYTDADGNIQYDEDIKSQQDLDNKGIDGEYIAESFTGLDQNGTIYQFGKNGQVNESQATVPLLEASGINTDGLIDINSIEVESNAAKISTASFLLTGVLIADDATVVGIADDFLVPFTAAIAVMTAMAIGEQVYEFSKVARGNQRDDGLRDWGDAEIAAELANLKGQLSTAQKTLKRKLQKEQKARGSRNKQKKGSEKGSGTGRK